ncbi:MAG: ABC transporter ATP-binding protein [Erysipelotrichaceae bacterium]|nr:ABC transporter ATP-binding protein [Erysipelotrichaceae bacterium]
MLKRFISYYKPYRKMFALDMLASLLISLVGMAYPILTNKITKEFVHEGKIEWIILFGIGLLVCYIIRMLLRYFVQYYGHVIGVKMQGDMRRDMFNKLQKLPFSYYDENETGKIMSRMTNDLQNVSELAHHGPENLFICGITIILSFVYLLTINWIFTVAIFACVPVLVVIAIFFRRRLKNTSMETRKAVASINARLESSITGIRVTKAFTNDVKESEKFEISNVEYISSRSRMYKAMGQFHSYTSFITDIFNVIILVVGGILVITSDQFDLSSYTTFIVSVNLFISPLNTLINFVEQYQDGVTGFSRFLEIMDQDEESVNEGAISIDKLHGNIEFKNVSFSYLENKEENIEYEGVLKNVSLNIQEGKTIALVGPSGGGKTTICHLIPNFYKVNQGEILIDGHNINDVTFHSLRKNIGIVQQDVFLFNGTIKENILYGNLDASDEEVYDAARKANIHDYILTLEDGYDTQIGERGIKLSGGQKQRLSIARVFLKNPSILILDEATSALDNATEILIQKALDDLTKGRTTLVVAHRLSTIKNADEIYVIEDGQIVEHGPHDELVNIEDGAYSKLYKAQFER